jgi:O-antigen ligase
MLWAIGVPWPERFSGLSPFMKLLTIPLLIAQFERSNCDVGVMKGFILSCTLLMIFSWYVLLFGPPLPMFAGKTIGVPVKDYIVQSGEFTICIALLIPVVFVAWREHRRGTAILLSLVALAFLANIFGASTSRTSLVVLPVLTLLFAARQFTWKAGAGILATAAVAGGLALGFAPKVQSNIVNVLHEVQTYTPEGVGTRAGERLEFWRKSVGFVADAPLIGHGTGSIHTQFTQAAEGLAGMAGIDSTNPHNQTFAIGIQLGLLGAIALFAMWFAHLRFFQGASFAAWAGFAIVVQNVVASLFNSHLFDFTTGWGYVLGVGITAGVVLRQRRPC